MEAEREACYKLKFIDVFGGKNKVIFINKTSRSSHCLNYKITNSISKSYFTVPKCIQSNKITNTHFKYL